MDKTIGKNDPEYVVKKNLSSIPLSTSRDYKIMNADMFCFLKKLELCKFVQ